MDPPTLSAVETYKTVLNTHNIPIEIEELDGFSLCWIGSKTAKSIIVNVCGGGLVLNPYPAHIQAQVTAYTILQENKQDISIVIVAHGLCPTSPWPTQLKQMVLTIEHLLETRSASTIHLSGDSAGGFLQLSLLLHITNPYPSPFVPSLTLPSGQNFASAFLFSPSPAYPFGSASVVQDPVTDIASGEGYKAIWDVVVSTNQGVGMPDKWLVPSLMEEEGWKGLRVGNVEIVAGGGEVLRGDILKVGERWKKVHDSDVVVYDCEGEVHCQFLLDILMGSKEDKESARLWKGWLKELKA